MTFKGFPDIDLNKYYTMFNPIDIIWDLFNNKPDNFLELFNFYEPIKLIDGEWTIILEVLNQVLYETDNSEITIPANNGTDRRIYNKLVNNSYKII